MRDIQAELKAKQSELKAKLAERSTRDLGKDVLEAAVPDGREAVVALAAEVIVGAMAVDFTGGALTNLVRIVGAGVGSAFVYGAVRSGVVAHQEWAELSRRAIGCVSNKVRDGARAVQKVVPEKVAATQHINDVDVPVVSPLASTPELLAQAMGLQGRKL